MMPEEELKRIDDEAAELAKRKHAMALIGAVGDNLANRQGFGNFYLGQMAPRQDVSGGIQRMADAMPDPIAKRKALLDAYKSKRDEEWKQKEFGLKEKQLGIQQMLANSKMQKAGHGLTEAQKSADREFGKEYIDYVARGGYADTKKGLDQLREVKEKLAKTDTATGPIVGMMSKVPLLGDTRKVFNPSSVAMQEATEEVIQRNLRAILGAQFTEKEGERLIARAYNPSLSEEENIKRLDRLIGQIERAADAKARAVEYYEKHGTLAGYKGELPSMKHFEDTPSGSSYAGDPKKEKEEGWISQMIGGPPATASSDKPARKAPVEMTEEELMRELGML